MRRYTEYGSLMKWDYNLEDPHQDARGFRAAELLQDTDESAYYEIDKNRPLSFEEIKSDLVLSNGARFYNDHAHPEYSTPECSTLRELVAQDKAGERILEECARRRNKQLAETGREVRLYKNNTDFVGHSYGCHDNYLMRRDVPWDRIVTGVGPVPRDAPDLRRRGQDGSRGRGDRRPARASSRFRSARISSASWSPSTR